MAQVAFLLVVHSVGCGGPAPDTFHLAGHVLVDGQPISNGYIQFVGKGPVVSAEILAGRYEAEHVPRGDVVVQFRVRQESGQMEHDPLSGKMVPELVDPIPEEYRDGIDLRVVEDSDTQHFDLVSKSQPNVGVGIKN